MEKGASENIWAASRERQSFSWYDTDFSIRKKIEMKKKIFKNLKSRCHNKRRMTTTQDIRDLFARCSPHLCSTLQVIHLLRQSYKSRLLSWKVDLGNRFFDKRDTFHCIRECIIGC